MSDKNAKFPIFFMVSFPILSCLFCPNEWHIFSAIGIGFGLLLLLINPVLEFILKSWLNASVMSAIVYLLFRFGYTDTANFLKYVFSAIS